MSGIDEHERLWILQYEEFIVDDYIYAYRGLKAQTQKEAEEYGKLIIDYFVREYNTSDDVENPDFKYCKVFSIDAETNPFLFSKEEMERLKERMNGE